MRTPRASVVRGDTIEIPHTRSGTGGPNVSERAPVETAPTARQDGGVVPPSTIGREHGASGSVQRRVRIRRREKIASSNPPATEPQDRVSTPESTAAAPNPLFAAPFAPRAADGKERYRAGP